jgi:hypothetical protein
MCAVPTAPAWLQRAGLGAYGMGTQASSEGARAEGVNVDWPGLTLLSIRGIRTSRRGLLDVLLVDTAGRGCAREGLVWHADALMGWFWEYQT